MKDKAQTKKPYRHMPWAVGINRKISAAKKGAAQAKFIGWPALQQSFEMEVAALKEQTEAKGKK